MSETNKREKKDMLDKLDVLDKKLVHSLLSTQEIDSKNFMNNRLSALLREEELKWYQRAKTKGLLQGDANTKYFQLIANGKHRKTRIYKLQDGDRIISGDADLKKHITTYYKNLFGSPSESTIRMDDTRVDDIPQVSEDKNVRLTAEFTIDEVKNAIF